MSFDSMFNMLLIVIGFGFLIGIHELGHFIAAKWAGIRTNAFAIGMGPQVFSYRKGVGFCYKSTTPKVIAKFGKDAPAMTDEELQQNNISETEYSLRLLPIGGFVSMLGQEDGNPNSVSQDPRSYNMCSIGKRMVVVSAGVVMNVLLACFLFLICFQVGVQFEAPVLGMIIPDSPAALANAQGHDALPLQPGDTVTSIDGKPVDTFTDIAIASAMAKPGVPVVLEVKREGMAALLTYSIMPASMTQKGLLELGVYPASSLVLVSGEVAEQALVVLQVDSALEALRSGMQMKSANGTTVEVWSQFNDIVQSSDGVAVETNWVSDKGQVKVSVPVQPNFSIIQLTNVPADAPQKYERGLLGMCPLTKISVVLPSSPNRSVFKSGDVIVKVASLEAPRMGQLRNYLAALPDGSVNMVVLRDGFETNLVGEINAGKLGVLLVDATDIPMVSQPLQQQLVDDKEVSTGIARAQLLGGSTILSINNKAVSNWKEIRQGLIDGGESVVLNVQNPTKGNPASRIVLSVSSQKRDSLSELGWSSTLSMQFFDSIFVVRSSGGNPIKALRMGFDETVDMLVMTYLTLDRLFRRSVGVEQLRGPIGIIHIGSKIADRGFSYLFFFLAIISVNLAVLNFLPLPIVDGGLFLYLIYEKFFKKPPSIIFQNAAAVLGLGLIATLFLVTFYNDIARLVG